MEGLEGEMGGIHSHIRWSKRYGRWMKVDSGGNGGLRKRRMDDERVELKMMGSLWMLMVDWSEWS